MADSSSSETLVYFPDTTIAEDFYRSEQGFAYGPERTLVAALLFDGLQAYMTYVLFDHEAEDSRYKEAFHWVHKRQSDYVFSFDNCCEALGIDPEFLRYGLANACNSKARRKRARRNF